MAAYNLDVSDDRFVPLEARAGDLVMWDEEVVHGSPPTLPAPAARRRVVQVFYADPDHGVDVEVKVDNPEVKPKGYEFGDVPTLDRGYIAARMRRLQVAADLRPKAPWVPDDETPAVYVPPSAWADDVAAVTNKELAALCGKAG